MRNNFIFLIFVLFSFYSNAQVVTLYNHSNAPFDDQNRTSFVTKIGDNIWVGEDRAILKFDGNNWERFENTDINCPWEYLWIYAIEEDDNGNIWAVGQAGIHKFDGNSWSFYGDGTPGIAPGTDQFNGMILTNDNKMIVTGGNTVWSWLYSIDLTSMEFTYFNRDDFPLLDDNIQDIRIDDNNQIILSGEEGGFLEFDGSSFVAHEAVVNFEFCKDNEGNYWSGGWTYDGPNAMFAYNSNFEEIQEFNTDNSLIPAPKVFRTAYNEQMDREVWFRAAEQVMDDGVIGIYNLDKEYFQVFDTESGMPGTKATSFYFGENTYWICVEGTGLVKIDFNESPYFALESGNIEFDIPAGSIQTMDLPIYNNGAASLNYNIDLSLSEPWLNVNDYNGSFTGNSSTHSLVFDATNYQQPTTLLSHLIIKSNGGHLRFNVIMNVVLNEGIDVLSEDARLYPNPIKNHLNIDIDQDIKQIRIYNIYGQLVYSEKNPVGPQYSLESLVSGQYIVKLEGEKFSRQYTILKQ